jgi:hypothetical protein
MRNPMARHATRVGSYQLSVQRLLQAALPIDAHVDRTQGRSGRLGVGLRTDRKTEKARTLD